MNLNFHPDADTVFQIRNLILPYLVHYFGRPGDGIDELVNNYYAEVSRGMPASEEGILDLLFHHDHRYHVAARIH